MPNPNLPINFRKNTYIGARYVPKFSDTPGSEWDNSIQYEPLTIVLYQGNSYTSKTFVPVGVDINNTTYWAETGNYNAQIEGYKEAVDQLIENVGALSDSVFYKFDREEIKFQTKPNIPTSDVVIVHIPNTNHLSVGVLPNKELNDVIYASYKFGASVAINGAVFDYKGTNLPYGTNVADGVSYPGFTITGSDLNNLELLVIKDNGKLDVMPCTTTPSQLKTLGIKNAIQGFYHLMLNGVPRTTLLNDELHGRSAVGQTNNGDVYLLCCAQNSYSEGLSYKHVIELLSARGCTFIYALDGGGTAQIAYHNVPLLPPSRDQVYRKNPAYLYVKAEFPEYLPNDNMYAIGNSIGNINELALSKNAFFTQSISILNPSNSYAGIEFYNGYKIDDPTERTAKINISTSSSGRGNFYVETNNGSNGTDTVLFANSSGIYDINDKIGAFYIKAKQAPTTVSSFRQLDGGIYNINNSANPKPFPVISDNQFMVFWQPNGSGGQGYGIAFALSGAYIITLQGSTYTVNKITTS